VFSSLDPGIMPIRDTSECIGLGTPAIAFSKSDRLPKRTSPIVPSRMIDFLSE
jgi:hypothetical protein